MESVLDNDLYKFTMQQAVLELFSTAEAEYTFINRGKQRFTKAFEKSLRAKISGLVAHQLTPSEKLWFERTCGYLKPSYFEYLKNYSFNMSDIKELVVDSTGNLTLRIAGPWHRTILWEVPLLALISETYFETIDTNWILDQRYKIALESKYSLLEASNCHVTEFGTRRRRNFGTQSLAVSVGKNYNCFGGSSNVYLSMLHSSTPRGTMAHEWIMGNSVLESLLNANYYAFHNWVRVFNADLGIALTDTYGLEAFLNNFNPRMAKLYDGVRHDSGGPLEFVDRVVKHYEKFRIDPTTKVALFSDALNVEKTLTIQEYCKGRIKASFGIGTYLTNDFSYCDSPPLNIVIKMSKLNGTPVVKLGEGAGKECGDKDALRVAKWTFLQTPLDLSRKGVRNEN